MSILDLLPTWRAWLTFLSLVILPWVVFVACVLLPDWLASRAPRTLVVTDDLGNATQLQPIE